MCHRWREQGEGGTKLEKELLSEKILIAQGLNIQGGSNHALDKVH